ncbi:Pyrimidine nucleotide transporter, mitochondrial [Coemansia biformis]|uniref:Pyrimidine nucleotide transporter, mitochondrial n=1 Tax=Coemansia biformis TaxID=1286918 RepID=A0A9W7YAQ3_9FUNG|nr:Pyrimidine nucleotide transporter, mitochondrial [Coemansia biformis]
MAAAPKPGGPAAQKRRVPVVVERHVDPWLHFVAGGLGGMAGAVATSPLDVLRTRQQLYGTQRPTATAPTGGYLMRAARPLANTATFLRDLCVKEGARGWFAGLGPALVGIVPSRAIQFFTYANGKQVLARWNGNESPLVQLSAAAFAAMVTTTATSPIWMVKTRMQLAKNGHRSSFACLRAIVEKEGLFGLYKGTSAAYLGASESAIQWMIYEQLKHAARARGTDATSKSRASWFEYFGAAAAAKLLASVVTYPHEVLRTRLRQPPDEHGAVKYRGLVRSARIIFAEEGLRGFYGGLTPHLLRTVPNASIMFLAYELVVYHFGTTSAVAPAR